MISAQILCLNFIKYYSSWLHVSSRADFHLFKRRGRNISGGVQATPLSELRQGLGVWVKAFHTKWEARVKQNFGGVEQFIRGVREILGGFNNLPP
jgi:hypothetical protein